MKPEQEIQIINAILTFLHRDVKLTPQEIETFQACGKWLQLKGNDVQQLLDSQAAADAEGS